MRIFVCHADTCLFQFKLCSRRLQEIKMLYRYSYILKYIPIVHFVYLLRFPILMLKGRIDYGTYYRANIKACICGLPVASLVFLVNYFFPRMTHIWADILFLPTIFLITYCFVLICASVCISTEEKYGTM